MAFSGNRAPRGETGHKDVNALLTAHRFDLDARALLFLSFLLLAWITLRPFGDLAAAENFDVGAGRDVEVYLAHAGFAAAMLYVVWRDDARALKRLADPFFLFLYGWIALSSLLSQDPATSLKRAALFAIVSASSAALFLLPRGKAQLAELLALAAAAVLALSYIGVALLPTLAVHQAGDFLEPQLAGDWRGVYGHKNLASQLFANLAFVGIFVFRSGRRATGAAIAGLSLLFVLNSGGKSSTVLCLAAIGVSFAAARVTNAALWAAIVFVPLLLLNLLGVGSALWAPFGALVEALPIDPTFTGRVDIWRFAAAQAAERPFFGYGFFAFWNTEALRYGADDPSQWATQAAHAHNAFLDAALGCGLPGLAATIGALALRPALDLRRAQAEGRDADTALLLAQIWLFELYLASFESVFFNRADPSWLTFLFAVFGLRYLAAYDVKK
jgi:O-antigen ligase